MEARPLEETWPRLGPDPHKSGSPILKALVRFGLGALGAYLGFVSAADNNLGSFEVWLAMIAGFAIALSLSMLGPFRRLVHLLAETMRWVVIAAICFAGLWLLFNPPLI